MDTPYGDIPDRFVRDMRPQEMHDYLQRRYGRRRLIKGALAGGLAVTAGPILWRQSSAAAAVNGAPQWIAFGPDPARSMYISWSAGAYNQAASVPSPQVRYGLDATYGSVMTATTTTVPVPAGYTQPSGDIDLTAYQHTLLEGLTPSTTYHYSVSNDGLTWGPDTTFTTGKSGIEDFRFCVTADEATSADSTAPIVESIASFNPDFTLVPGDLSYASGGVLLPSGGGAQPAYTPSAWDQFFSIVGPGAAQSIPWMVSVGNHEMEPLTDDGYAGFLTRFPYDYGNGVGPSSGSPVTRTFTYGNVAFIELDGNDLSAEITPNNGYTDGAQTTWLTNQLAAYRAAGSDVDFIVVSFHNCCFCSNQTHGSDGGIRSAWQPLFDTYSVDLVVSGHVHAYERSYPIMSTGPTVVAAAGSLVTPATQGTTYICAGGGGQSLYTTWFGTTGGGDSGTGPVTQVYELVDGESVPEPDTILDFSAYRVAAWTHLVIDVTVPTTQGGVTQMHIRAIDPTQNSSGVTSIVDPAVIDSVTLQRNSTVSTTGPGAALPEVATPALLVAGAVGGAAWWAARHRTTPMD